MKHNKITLICFTFIFFSSIFIGCQNPSINHNDPTNAASGTNEGGNNGNGENSGSGNSGNGGVTIGEDGTVTITSRNVIYIGEESETIDSNTYLVKKYAELPIADCPYFYTCYKLYYLNNKLRRTYLFYHSMGQVELDYTYENFIPHSCGNNQGSELITEYYESGKIFKTIQINTLTGTKYKYEYLFNENGIKTSYTLYMNDVPTNKTTYYPSGTNESITQYQNGKIYYVTKYYENGKEKESYNYNNDVYPSYLSYKRTYYENGKEEWDIRYNPDGTESYKEYHTYYNNGNLKTTMEYRGSYNDYYVYYDNSSTTKKIDAYYNNLTNQLEDTKFYYESSYLHYFYDDSGYLYTYEDGKTKSTSTNSSVYSSKINYTSEQAQALINSMM